MDKLIKNGKKVIKLAQNNLEFYPYDNENDAVDVNGKKYYTRNSLIGKKMNIPKGIWNMTPPANMNDWRGHSWKSTLSYTSTILAVFPVSTGEIVVDDCPAMYMLSDVKPYIQNGGVTDSLLTHIYQVLERFVTAEMEVA